MKKKFSTKYRYTLTLKALYPSTIQKQNANLALKVFNENNVALRHIAKTCDNLLENV